MVEFGEILGVDSKVWYVEDYYNDVLIGRCFDGVFGFFVVVVEIKKMIFWRLYYVFYLYLCLVFSCFGMYECFGFCFNVV